MRAMMSSTKCNVSTSMRALLADSVPVGIGLQAGKKNAFNRHPELRMSRCSKRPNWLASAIMHPRANLLALLSAALLAQLLISLTMQATQVTGNPVLMRVCDTREVKTVTSRVCMLYKRTKNSDVKLDKQGNLRITRSSSASKGEYSPAKLAHECCKIGCPPHIFANIC